MSSVEALMLDREQGHALDQAAVIYYERPGEAEATALAVRGQAQATGAAALESRALALLGAISLNRGDIRGAVRLAAESRDAAERSGDDQAGAQSSALAAQLHFWSGSYGEALRAARGALDLAEATGDDGIRLSVLRAVCVVMGNLEAPGWDEALDEMVALSVRLGDRWQEAISRNDLGHHHMARGDQAAAEVELARGVEAAHSLAPHNRFALAVLGCTRAQLRLAAEDHAGGLADIERSLADQAAADEIHPYLFGMSVGLQVRALLALGRADEAERCGDSALERLGDRVPQARGVILQGVAAALRDAGRLEAAYDALARGAELERAALLELVEVQVGFERASAEARTARSEAAALTEANRTLRDQADRDALTGLHNRRYLDARLAELAARPPAFALSLALIDLDHFKRVNDDFGHAVGDTVLVRVGRLLAAHLRATDHLVRSGGEELVVLMPATDSETAERVCERLLAALREDAGWAGLRPGLRVTASAGIATWAPGDPLDVVALLASADAGLYAAKRAGRDRLVVAAAPA